MTRRQFAFWIGFGLFNLSEKLRADTLDALAAKAMRLHPTASEKLPKSKRSDAVHWRVDGDDEWRWFECENLINDQWVQTGITAPIHKSTGKRKPGEEFYLDDSLVPVEVRAGLTGESARGASSTVAEPQQHLPSSLRRARHGRPPSKWLRSLDASELRIWLKTIDVPEAGVEGMTYFEHLTRDHSFSEHVVKELSIKLQAKLHAAAHFGY